MDTLTELYNQAIVPLDQELEKQAGEMYKQAEEEDAAGRIMARGFADELNKIAMFHGAEGGGMDYGAGGGYAPSVPTPNLNRGPTKPKLKYNMKQLDKMRNTPAPAKPAAAVK